MFRYGNFHIEWWEFIPIFPDCYNNIKAWKFKYLTVYNNSNITLIILDNSTTGMTGHQQHPATGYTLKMTETSILPLDDLVKTIGVKDLHIVDSYNLSEVEEAVRKATNTDGVSVVICKHPCALLKTYKAKPALHIDGCKKCGMCLKIGCPAINKQKDGSVMINPAQCVGCGVCQQLCKFSAIKGGQDNE